jgi:hypothetical protein
MPYELCWVRLRVGESVCWCTFSRPAGHAIGVSMVDLLLLLALLPSTAVHLNGTIPGTPYHPGRSLLACFSCCPRHTPGTVCISYSVVRKAQCMVTLTLVLFHACPYTDPA